MKKQNYITLVLLFLVVSLPGCAQFSGENLEQEMVYPAAAVAGSQDIFPVFTTLGSEHAYNRIGTVEAVDDGDSVLIRVDGSSPTIYKETSEFKTGRGWYENTIYRVHFEKTPFSIIPFYLTAGKHPGLLVVLTRDQRGRLVLVTTVHTCGCYVAIIPTGWIDEQSLPPDWPEDQIRIYGEILPARLPAVESGQILEFIIRPDTHRVMDIRVVDGHVQSGYDYIKAPVKSQKSLRHLETEKGREVSLYYDSWPLTGHVRGAFKWWEMLLLSIPSLDLFVGMDKDFGSTELTGNPFYTSLQPWFRTRSDMNDFSSFLQFYGWGL